MKNLRCQVLSFLAVLYPVRYVGVDALEIILIQLGKVSRILLCRFDQEPLVCLVLKSLQNLYPGCLSCLANPVRSSKSYGAHDKNLLLQQENAPKLQMGNSFGRLPGQRKPAKRLLYFFFSLFLASVVGLASSFFSVVSDEPPLVGEAGAEDFLA